MATTGKWTVGELAKRTGLTVRTLHHYDDIGLLRPSRRGSSGRRLYTASDVARLQQALSLKQLGFSLDEIRDCLDKPDFQPLQTLRLHIARLRQQIELERKLCERLEAVAAHLGAAEEVPAEAFLRAIEAMTMIENYYTPEQLEYLKERAEQVGPERMQQAPADWAALGADIEAAMAEGIDPGDPRARELAKRWQGLIDEFTGGNPTIEQSLQRLWKEQGPALAAQHQTGYNPQAAEYIGKALAAMKAAESRPA